MRIEGLWKTYPGSSQPAVQDVSLDVYDGEGADCGSSRGVQIFLAEGYEVPSGMVGGTAQAALFLGEQIEYQIEVERQGVVVICGERHTPIEEGSSVWLKLRRDGHSAWPSALIARGM